jgi:hypothetical protein
MLNLLCIILLAAGPWIGPVWPEVSSVPNAHRAATIYACPTGEIQSIASPLTPDVRTADDVSTIVGDAVVDPPEVFPGRDHQRSALPQPRRIFLITALASSFL